MLSIRPEEPEDIDAIRYVNELAFAQKTEAEIVNRLRDRGAVTLSLVCRQDCHRGQGYGFKVSRFRFDCHRAEENVPYYSILQDSNQRKGIGSRLVRDGLKECRHLGHEIVVVLGHPDYYPRFGFVPAGPGGIDCEFEVPEEAWMILELRQGALAGRKGRVRFQPEFGEAV